MADYPDIFTFPPSRRRIHVREEFIGICAFAPTPLCAGMLLSVFERWTQFRLEERRKIANSNEDRNKNMPLPHLWIFMSAEQLYREILFSYGLRTIQNNLQWLVDQKYIRRRNNPDKGWDRTYQYRLHFSRIQHALNVYADLDFYFDPPKTRPITQNCVMDHAKLHNALRKSAQALPRSSSRSSSQKGESADKPRPAPITKQALQQQSVKSDPLWQAYEATFFAPPYVTQKQAGNVMEVIQALRAAGVKPEQLTAYMNKFDDGRKPAFVWLAERIPQIIAGRGGSKEQDELSRFMASMTIIGRDT